MQSSPAYACGSADPSLLGPAIFGSEPSLPGYIALP